MAGCNGLIVFSDLDGTLLDHETYDWSPALPALEALKAGGHWLVLASSKTAAEIAPLRAELGFAHCPAIVENGAGILPGGDRWLDGNDHARILAALGRLPGELRACFSGFSDWSVEETARRTGLAPDAAGRAKQRQFSEPGRFSGGETARAAFIRHLAREGISAQQGGRFLTLSFGATKAGRMQEITNACRADDPELTTVALGDAPNDIAMLEAADTGFIIANPAHEALPPLDGETAGRIKRSVENGPAGWNRCVLSVTNRMKR